MATPSHLALWQGYGRLGQPVVASDQASSTGFCSSGVPGGEAVEEHSEVYSLLGKISGLLGQLRVGLLEDLLDARRPG